MKRRSRLRRALLLLAVVAAAVLVGRALAHTGPLRDAELSSIDARFDIRGKQRPRPDVVVVGADDKTVGREELPLNRKHYATGIDRLAKAGAKVIAVPIEFTEAICRKLD